MAFRSASRLCTYAIILSFYFTSGVFGQAGSIGQVGGYGQAGSFGQAGGIGQVGGFGQAGGVGPAQIITKALSCFSEKYIYQNCEESYRLDQSGELHVPPEYVNEYCEGPCQEETGLILNCLHGIFANFIFYNKATITVIKDTIHEGCSFGPERGNFNVAGHLQADSAVSTDFAYQIVFAFTSILVGLMFIL